MNTLKHLRTLLFTAFAGLLFQNSLYAQNKFLKPLDKGVPLQVIAGCADSLDNLYVAYASRGRDSVIFRRWDITAGTWSPHSAIAFRTISYNTFARMCYYRGQLYFTLNQYNNYRNTSIWRYNGGWSGTGTLKSKMNYDPKIGMTVFSNKLYFHGPIDSVDNQAITQVAVYNGSAYSSAGFPDSLLFSFYHDAAETDQSGDTLYMVTQNRVFYHVAPSKWGVVYTHVNTIKEVAVADGRIHCNSGMMIWTLTNDTISAIVNLQKQGMKLTRFGKRLFVSHHRNYYNTTDVFGEIRQKAFKPYFFNSSPDTLNLVAINSNHRHLYFVSGDQVLVNEVDYNHIAEVLTDSLTELPLDTIVTRFYRDLNANGRKDISDLGIQSYFYVKPLMEFYTSDLNGEASIYPYDAEDYEIEFYGLVSADSCYKPAFSGNFKSRTFNSARRRDTIDIPFRNISSRSKNIVVRTHARPLARMMEAVPLYIHLRGSDCNAYNYDADVSVKLQDSAILKSSSVQYASVSGNTYKFNLRNISNAADYVLKLEVLYPNDEFSLGQTVRHFTRIRLAFAEDSLDNTDSIVQKLVYSYDPNEKHSIPEGTVTKDVRNIRYYIHFQNEGNADAYRVRVVDTMNLNLPVYAFQMVSASHPYTIGKRGNVVTWTFDNIYLKPKDQDEAGSKGYLVFDAKVNGQLRIGDSIMNRASIYFDYNPPIHTNAAVIRKADEAGSVAAFIKAKSFSLYPNPGSGLYTVVNSGGADAVFSVYDVRGVLIRSFTLTAGTRSEMDLTAFSKGIYVISRNTGERIVFVLE